MNRKLGAVLLIIQRSLDARDVIPTTVKVVRHEIQLGQQPSDMFYVLVSNNRWTTGKCGSETVIPSSLGLELVQCSSDVI